MQDVMVARFLPLEPHDSHQVAGYILHARLGSGGMGNVFLSFTPGGRAVAIKVMRREYADDPEFRRRFSAEVSAARRVQGLYTAPVVDADPDAPLPWLATAYVAGPSLQQAVDDYGAFPLLTVFRLLGGVAEGLAAIHAAGLIHRDLKPSNVLLAEDGPRVIDFGIAYAADAGRLTSSGVVIGTPAFMAPEQALGRTVTTAADVFALAHLTVFAATGHTVFGEGHHAAVIYRIANEAPDLEGCPDSLRRIAGRCLAKNPSERPGLTEIMSYAQRILAGQGMQFAMSSWLPRPVAATVASYDNAPPPSAPVPTAPSSRARTGPYPTPGMARSAASSSPESASTPGAPATIPPASRPAASPRRHARIRATVGALVAAACVTGGFVAFKAGYLGALTRAGSPGNAASTLPGGYIADYSHTRFPMPGKGCEGGPDSVPATANFSGQSPQVITDLDSYASLSSDMVLGCNGNPGISFSAFVQVAQVSGSPGPRACATAAERRPLSVTARYSLPQLKLGTQFCLISTRELVLLTLLSKSNLTYDLTWDATGWTLPLDG
jgi:serine/threonine protein kinase